MTTRASTPVVLVVVPPGSVSPAPLVEAISAAHPGWRAAPVWAGDPHLRPVLGGPVPAWSGVDDDRSPLRQRQLASRAPHDALWLRAITAARRAVADGADRVVVLVAGSVAVLAPLDALVAPLDASADAVAVFVPRTFGPLTDDGRTPDEQELVTSGSWSTDVIALSRTSGALLDWLERQLTVGPVEGCIGRVFDRAATAFAVATCADPAIGVGEWRWDVEAPALVDLPAFDPAAPWTLAGHRGRRARIDVAADGTRQAVLAAATPQLAGEVQPVALPGGLMVDDVIRSLVSGDPACPAPWSATAAFRAWLEPRYWTALHDARRDLTAAFPAVRSGDAERFRNWCRRAFVDDRIAAVIGVPHDPSSRWGCDDELDGTGLNVVGYFRREFSLGGVARGLTAALRAASIPFAALATERSVSPTIEPGVPLSDRLRHRSTVAVVSADQFPVLATDHPELFTAETRLIGYWFWELEHVPAPMRATASMVDEIWVGSRFVADAFRAAVDTPVRHVPIPVAPPIVSARDRVSFQRLAAAGDRFVFAVVFDHFSVTERKNPVGVIDAFRRAFAPDEGPVLVVKSMNASTRWPQHQRVVAAAGDRPDIVLWDEHLDRSDQMAFIRSVDALVSLHRSEGLGLHLAEAMWLGTPVIATRYSGNLDLMDDDCSVLIDCSMVPVERGEGGYPPEAWWADPDLDQAARAMQQLATDPARCAALADAGRARMEQQPTLADTGRLIADLLGIEPAR